MITVAVTRIVRPGNEPAFEAALHHLVERSLGTAGQLGVHVLRPASGSGSREYGILRRFASEADLEAFCESQDYRDYDASVASLTEGQARRERVSGLEAWFTSPGRAIVPPPRWKMALVTLLGVYPVSLLLQLLLKPLTPALPNWAVGLLMSACMIVCLTWLVMPLLARLFHSWLAVRTGADP